MMMDQSTSSREEEGPKDEVINSMLNSARSAMKLGMFEEAKGRLEEILECGTTDIQLLGKIYMYYGRLSRFLKHETQALAFFEHELNVYKLTFVYPNACDSSRRIIELALSMGKFSKAKRCAEDLIDYTSNRKEGEPFVKQARILLATVCLEGFERNMENNPDENKRLLTICTDQIALIKELNKESKDHTSEVEVLMLEAKCFALGGKVKEAHRGYQACIDLCVKTDQLNKIHRAYYEKAHYAEENMLIFIIHDLRSALFYVSKYGTDREVVKYKRDLADKLMTFGNAHEGYSYAMEALETVHKQNFNAYLKDTLLLVAKCLTALGKRRQAAYFILLGSLLTIKQDYFEKFYKLIDEVMTAERNDAKEGADVSIEVDSSTDPVTPNEFVSKFVVKLEHATSVETWRVIVNGIIEDQQKPAPVVEEKSKENEEPMDFMDLICKMNTRMDDQRTEMPASLFAAPRPISAASRKTTKSHRILPGLRANLAKMQNMKFDTQTVNRLLKRSKKSKTSLHSTSTQGDDTRSDDITVMSK